jgi:hypothetical protein
MADLSEKHALARRLILSCEDAFASAESTSVRLWSAGVPARSSVYVQWLRGRLDAMQVGPTQSQVADIDRRVDEITVCFS